MIRLTRRYQFCASHRLHSAAMTEAENQELYGKCNNPFGHGHNYVLEIGLQGSINPRTGQVADIRILDGIVRQQVIRDFDHKYVNEEVGEFSTKIATTENLAAVIRDRLRDHWPKALPSLVSVRIRETARNTVELKRNETN